MNAKDSKNCKYFNTCNAQLCPLDEESLENCIWYSNEDICKLQGAGKLLFIKQQKKLKRKCKYIDTYFTYSMLNKNTRIGNTKGLDPNKPEGPQLKKWLKNHKEIKKLNDEEKEKMRKSFIENVLKKNNKQG